MNIAFFIAEMRPSGVATFVIELGVFLARTGHTVSLVAGGQGEWWPLLAAWESAASHVRRLARHFSAVRYAVVFLSNGVGVRPAMTGLHRWPDSIAAVWYNSASFQRQ